ncbi:MAG: hypothetical protein EAZ15_07715 [Sphingobacteriales bacterium]|nr:MAG: hypothetical protein EAZ15_07715 [Sphingobacteriales bacterium]
MEQPKQDFDGVTDRIKDYVNLRIEIIKLKVIEKIVSIAASILAYVLIAVFALIFLLAAFFSLGFFLAEITGSNAAGFGLLSIILLVVVWILFLIKDKRIIQPLQNKFIANIFKNW